MERLFNMFKIGDMVKITGTSTFFDVGDNGKIIGSQTGYCKVEGKVTKTHYRSKNGYSQTVKLSELKLLKRGRPTKIKYIAQYEIDGDPVKEFYSRKELLKWLKQCEDEDVQWDSIRIYPVDKVMKPHKNVKISLRRV